MLYNKSTLIQYIFELVNTPNRGRAKNAEIKHCKMLHFYAALFLTGVVLHFFRLNAAITAKVLHFFATRPIITISKKPLCQVSRLFEFGASADRIAAFPRVPIVEKVSRVSYWEEGLIRKNIRCVFYLAYLYITIVLVEKKKSLYFLLF